MELTGSSPAHATVKALDPAGTMVRSTDSDGDGHWSLVLPVQKGSNEFTLSAHDPETGRESPSRQVIIAVAVPASPTPVPTPAPTGLVALPAASTAPSEVTDASPSLVVVADAALEVTSPRNGARSNDPTVAVKGTTNAPSVRATASWVSSGKPPAKPDALRLAAKDGSFSGRFVLAPGRWKIAVTTTATDQLTSVTQTHSVNVVYNGFAVEVGTTAKGRAWVQITVDGQPVPSSGRIMSNGESQVVVAKQSVVINTGYREGHRRGHPGWPDGGHRAGQGPGCLAYRQRQGTRSTSVSDVGVGGSAHGVAVDDEVRSAASATTEDLVRLAGLVGRRLVDVQGTVSTAESCTGGLIGHVLTEISGSSAWYLGGAVVYSDELKRLLVAVPGALIRKHGAVSAEVAQAMAEGARRRFGTTLAVSVTGIAGPTGGSDTKPVGLTYVAVADDAGCRVERHLWDGDRSANKRESAHAALRLLLDRLTA